MVLCYWLYLLLPLIEDVFTWSRWVENWDALLLCLSKNGWIWCCAWSRHSRGDKNKTGNSKMKKVFFFVFWQKKKESSILKISKCFLNFESYIQVPHGIVLWVVETLYINVQCELIRLLREKNLSKVISKIDRLIGKFSYCNFLLTL